MQRKTVSVICRFLSFTFSLLRFLFLLCNDANMKITRNLIVSDPRIQRLLRNSIWEPVADAAMDYLLDGKDCPITSWKKSSTWAQVNMVWQELNDVR